MSLSASSGYSLNIGIIGGGIGGLCLALGLDNKGVKATVYDSTRNYRKTVASLGLGPNGIKALSLIDSRLTKGVLKAGSSNRWIWYEDTVFNFRQGQDTKEWKTFHLIDRVKHPLGMSTITRADFLDEVFKLLGGGIVQFLKRVVSISQGPGHKTSLSFSDGSRAEHDLVVGCDGIRSVARKYVLGEDSPSAWPNWSNKVYRYGYVDMSEATHIVGEEFARNGAVYLGEHAHLVTFPVPDATKLHVGGYAPKATWPYEELVQRTTREEMMAEYRGWGEKLVELLSHVQDTHTWAVFDLPYGASFVRDKVALLGDAAHASTPFQGSGSSMAIEDAYILSNLLASVTRPGQVASALRAYDLVRRPRGQELVKTSQDMGKVLAYESPHIGKDLERTRADLCARFKWIWDEDLEGELAQAMAIMGQQSA